MYEVRDHQRGTMLALKRLAQLDAQSLHRFKREFRSLVDVAHPNLVALHELFSDDEGTFFTMDLVPGIEFVAWVRSTSAAFAPTVTANGSVDATAATVDVHALSAFDERRLRAALGQLATAVSAIHAAGMVHRDLKPSNVLVRDDGRVVVLDFGLVTATAPDKSALGTIAAGTPAFMAPEQARGDAVGPAADWYAVGGMIYEALTGRLPFEGSALAVLAKKQTERPAHPHAIAPDVPDDLAALAMELLEPDATKRAGAARAFDVLGVVASGVTIAEAEPRSDPFVGREDEMARLCDAFAKVAPTRPVVALVHAASGMGKSALVREFLRRVREQRATVLQGRCYEREQVPFKALDALLDAIARRLAALGPLDAARMLPRDVDALVRLFPTLRRVEVVARASRAVTQAADAIDLRRRGARALRELLQRLSDHERTVVFIDDIQWSDDDSAEILAEVLGPPEAPALMLVLAYRDGDADDSALLHALPAGDVTLLDVALGALDARDAAELAERLGAGARAGDIARDCEGSPFFVTELARDTSTESVTLGEAILRRVRKLEAPAQRLLEVVAAAGHPLARNIAMRAANLQAADEVAAVKMLRVESLIRLRDPDLLETFHDRVRETVASSLDESASRACHASIALAYEGMPEPPPDLMAFHSRMAGDVEREHIYAEAAGDAAMRALAFDAAADHYARVAQSDAARSEVIEKLGNALVGAGRLREGADALLRASAMRGGIAEKDLRRRAAEQYMRASLFDKGMETITPLLREVGLPVPRSRWWAIVLFVWQRAILAVVGWRIVRGADDARARTRATLALSMLWGLIASDTVRGGLYHAYALRSARRANAPELLSQALLGEALFVSGVGRAEHAERVIAYASEIAAKGTKWPAWDAMHGFVRGYVCIASGRVGEARTLLQQAYEAADALGGAYATEKTVVRTWFVFALWLVGDLHDASRQVHEAIRDYRSTGYVYGIDIFEAFGMPCDLLAKDRPDEARRVVESVIERTGDATSALLAWLSMAQIAAYASDATLARRAREGMRRTMAGSLLGRVSYYRGMAACAHGMAFLVEGEDASSDARMLEREGAYWMPVVARTIRAALADTAAARAVAYDEVAVWSRSNGYPMYAEAAEARVAELRDDETKRRAAFDALRARGVVNPEAFTRMLMPMLG